MRYIQASGTTFTRHLSSVQHTVFGPDHFARPRDLTPAEVRAFGVHELKLVTPPSHNPLTQTRTDGPALLTAGVWTQNWVIAPLPALVAAEVLVAAKAAFILQVKAEAGQLTSQVLSGLASEYELAEKEATAYKAAGYPAATATVPLPGSVKSEINSKAAKGVTITATVACDTILTAANGWRNAQASLRDKRLSEVSAATIAVDAAALDTIKASWEAFMVALKTQLG